MAADKKIALVTGSTDGVGRYVALALQGYWVLVHGRDQARGELVLQSLRKSGGDGELLLADFASLEAVGVLAANVLARFDRLDLLVNNAGIGFAGAYPGRHVGTDGHELRFTVNYLSGFLLTRRLLPRVRAAAQGRVVNVSSVGQTAIDFSDVMLERGYSGVRAYCQSKLAQIMFTFDLAEELSASAATANCLHPATYMDTHMVRADGVGPMTSVEQGSKAILNLAVSDALAGVSGTYFDGLRPARAQAQAYDPEARRRLRELSVALTGA